MTNTDPSIAPLPSKLRIYCYTQKKGSDYRTSVLLPGEAKLESGNYIQSVASANKKEESIHNAIRYLLTKFWITKGLAVLADSRWGEDLVAKQILISELKKPSDTQNIKTLLHTANSHYLIDQCVIAGKDDCGLSQLRGKSVVSVPDGENKNEYLAYLAKTIEDNREVPKTHIDTQKPKLLLHICCAPDLARPLRWLKQYFKLCLFRYNPNIHPRLEHEKRYAQFIKLTGLEKGDYEILEDRYDPKEFFDDFYEKRTQIKKSFQDASYKDVIATSAQMEEWGDRCNPCYSMRLEQAAKNAAKHQILYFTSTLLISPKKKRDKLFRRGVESEKKYPDTHFLRFDFAKNDGHFKALEITKEHKLWRQNYCGCAWTISTKKN